MLGLLGPNSSLRSDASVLGLPCPNSSLRSDASALDPSPGLDSALRSTPSALSECNDGPSVPVTGLSKTVAVSGFAVAFWSAGWVFADIASLRMKA